MNYGEAEKKVIGLKQKIEESKGRRIEAERRVQDAEAYLSSLSERFKAAVLDGKGDELKKIESETPKIQSMLNRDKALCEGLDQEIPKLEKELKEGEDERARLFVELSAKYLKGVVKEYDQAVESLRAVVGKMLACASLCNEAGELQTYLQAVGGEDLANILRDMRIPTIKGFDISEWRQGKPFIFVTDALKRAVKSEIEGR